MSPKRQTSRAKINRILLFGIFVVHSFSLGNPQDKFVKVFFPGGKSVTAELAVSEEERARGLMFRKEILPGQGMLFVFREDGIHSFWMKNTLVSLDILWLDGDKRIIHIEADVPPCREEPCPSYGPLSPSRYVLELKAGRAAELGLEVSNRLQFILPDWIDSSLCWGNDRAGRTGNPTAFLFPDRNR